MKVKVIVYCCLAGLNVLLLQPTVAVAQSTANWQRINVDGLKEWSDPGKWWSEQDGVIVAESVGGKALPKEHNLVWNGSVKGDFEFRLEYRILAKTPQDAGVFFLVERQPGFLDKPGLVAYQAELDTCTLYSKKPFIRKGKLFGNIHVHVGKVFRMFKKGSRVTIEADGKESITPLPQKFQPARVFRKPPKWNECRIRVEGDLIQLHLNDRLANEIVNRDVKLKSTGDGIALQFRPYGAHRFEVRNLMYRTIDR